ncbi:hypothetical protein VNO77_09749 [Canavalia gladiata]
MSICGNSLGLQNLRLFHPNAMRASFQRLKNYFPMVPCNEGTLDSKEEFSVKSTYVVLHLTFLKGVGESFGWPMCIDVTHFLRRLEWLSSRTEVEYSVHWVVLYYSLMVELVMAGPMGATEGQNKVLGLPLLFIASTFFYAMFG